jgi:predicted DNA-binding transcriptional regulator YafY
MARGENQKLKLLYLAKIFMEETDEGHSLTRQEIIRKLNTCGVNADRKTIYSDLEELRTFGLDIITEQEGNEWRYYLGEREFELAELKLLVDSVQSSKFITEKKSQSLIRKLEHLVSVHEAKQLHRQVLISGRVKTMNESIYYNVDKIHTAINADSRIRFQYFQWNAKKEMELRHDGAWYDISPWALVWDDENYYMIGYDEMSRQLKHYRVDKMLKISLTKDKRQGKEHMKAFNLSAYSRRLFGMYGGEQTRIALEAKNHMAGVLIDRFGKDIPMIPQAGGRFTAYIDVAVSPQFLGWIISLGKDIKITGPEHVVNMMKTEARRLLEQYKEY